MGEAGRAERVGASKASRPSGGGTRRLTTTSTLDAVLWTDQDVTRPTVRFGGTRTRESELVSHPALLFGCPTSLGRRTHYDDSERGSNRGSVTAGLGGR